MYSVLIIQNTQDNRISSASIRSGFGSHLGTQSDMFQQPSLSVKLPFYTSINNCKEEKPASDVWEYPLSFDKNDDSVKEAPAYCRSFLDSLHS